MNGTSALKLDARYTYKDYSSWPEDERWELIDGIAYAKAAPSQSHQSLLLKLARQLGSYLDGKPCKVFIAPFSVRLNADTGDDTVVEPDILVVCDKSKLDGKGVVGAPDMVIEILSPSTAKYDRDAKFKLYLRSGVKEYCIVDPDLKLLTVHILHEVGYVSRSYNDQDTAVPVEVLDDCTINLVDVFEVLDDML